jgi:hypothetical protein
MLIANPYAVDLLIDRKNKFPDEYFNWDLFCLNENSKVIEILKKNKDKINFRNLCQNKMAIELLEELAPTHSHLFCPTGLSMNENVTEKLFGSISSRLANWTHASRNPNLYDVVVSQMNKTGVVNKSLFANPNIFEYNYENIRLHFFNTFGEELIKTLFHPKNAAKWTGWAIDNDCF